jgi:iron complex transport system substrate-binding protein
MTGDRASHFVRHPCLGGLDLQNVIADRIPRRVVCLQPSATVILAALNCLDQVVACTKYCADVCPEAGQGRTIVADSWTAKSAEILALQPDLVVAAVPYQEKAVSEILKSGARFLGLAPRTLADIYSDIALLARVMGADEQGQQIVVRMEEEIASVRARTPRNDRPRVFCEEWGKPLIASQPWVAELVEAAGGEFVGQAGRQTTAESVREKDPDILVAAWCGAGDRVPLKKIVRDRRWTGMRAVRQRRVYCVRDEFLNTPAPTLISGLQALAAAIHPNSFPAAAGLRQITEVRDSRGEYRVRL